MRTYLRTKFNHKSSISRKVTKTRNRRILKAKSRRTCSAGGAGGGFCLLGFTISLYLFWLFSSSVPFCCRGVGGSSTAVLTGGGWWWSAAESRLVIDTNAILPSFSCSLRVWSGFNVIGIDCSGLHTYGGASVELWLDERDKLIELSASGGVNIVGGAAWLFAA